MIKQNWYIPVKLESAANLWAHWGVKKARHEKYDKELMAIRPEIIKMPLPCVIRLTRVSPRELDYDNLLHAFKPVRDTISQFLIPEKKRGHGDSDKRIKWEYAQRKGPPKTNAFEIYIEATNEGSLE